MLKILLAGVALISSVAFSRVENITYKEHNLSRSFMEAVSEEGYRDLAKKSNNGLEVEKIDLGREVVVFIAFDTGSVVATLIDDNSYMVFTADRVYLPDLIAESEEFRNLYKKHSAK